MKFIYRLTIPLLLISVSCSADVNNNSLTVAKLLNHFIPEQNKNFVPSFKLGDFNGDGLQDIAVLFIPSSKPKETTQLKVTMPWMYPTTKKSNKYHKSLVIFQKSKKEWLSKKTKIYAMLDITGVLETPSFKLLTSKKSDADYKQHTSMLPVKTDNDLIILPTEAGIDTYIYWDKNTYKLYEPEEMP